MVFIKNYGITRIKRVAYSPIAQPFWIDSKANKKRNQPPPIKLEISRFSGWKSWFSSLVPDNCQIQQHALCWKEYGQHSLSGKECDSMPFMWKLESTLCIEKLHVTLSANRRNLKELAISWNGRLSMDKHGSFWQTSARPVNNIKTWLTDSDIFFNTGLLKTWLLYSFLFTYSFKT